MTGDIEQVALTRRNFFWNISDHFLTRLLDALSTFVIVREIAPDIFARLSTSQALVAPLLLLFPSPETILYKDFGRWVEMGVLVVRRHLRMLRTFALLKVLGACFIALLLGEGNREKAFALLWAFSLVIGPQVLGPDREFLRLSLHLKFLNILTLTQKSLFLFLTFVCVFFFNGKIEWLFAASSLSFAAVWVLARVRINKAIMAIPEKSGPRIEAADFRRALLGFSFWQHIWGVISQTVQTADVFFLGLFLSGDFRVVGIYSVAAKLSNLTTALPLAISNLFGVWLGRQSSIGAPTGEKEKMRSVSWALLATSIVQGLGLWVLLPYLLEFLSRNRYNQAELQQVSLWVAILSIGYAFFSQTFPLTAWWSTRGSIRNLVLKLMLPWGGITYFLIGALSYQYGPDGAALGLTAGAIFYFLWVRLSFPLS